MSRRLDHLIKHPRGNGRSAFLHYEQEDLVSFESYAVDCSYRICLSVAWQNKEEGAIGVGLVWYCVWAQSGIFQTTEVTQWSLVSL